MAFVFHVSLMWCIHLSPNISLVPKMEESYISCTDTACAHPQNVTKAEESKQNHKMSPEAIGINGCFRNIPQIIQFHRVFLYKPSIFGYPYFLETPKWRAEHKFDKLGPPWGYGAPRSGAMSFNPRAPEKNGRKYPVNWGNWFFVTPFSAELLSFQAYL